MIVKKQPNPIDVHVGGRVRLRRGMIGMSQERLGQQLGITFQQIQKYEKGTNRIGASRLQAIARILLAPVSYFFEDAPGNGTAAAVADAFDKLDLDIARASQGLNPSAKRGVLNVIAAIKEGPAFQRAAA
jgi:transcriptional regulator with XRE-family HTH domain